MTDTSDTEDPMAYLVFATDGSESNAVYSTDGEAQAAADAWGWQIAPLYLAPRLTDAEQEAVESALWDLEQNPDDEGCARSAATLRGLLERMIPPDDPPNAVESGGDSAAAPGKSVETAIPPAWLAKPYYVDPPSGHRYGFPKLYDPSKDGDLRAWMIANGYPKRMADQGLPCTFTACTEDGEN